MKEIQYGCASIVLSKNRSSILLAFEFTKKQGHPYVKPIGGMLKEGGNERFQDAHYRELFAEADLYRTDVKFVKDLGIYETNSPRLKFDMKLFLHTGRPPQNREKLYIADIRWVNQTELLALNKKSALYKNLSDCLPEILKHFK